MKNKALISWIDQLIPDYERQILSAERIVELLTSRTMRTHTNNVYDTEESLAKWRQSIEVLRNGIKVMGESRAELLADG